METGAPEDLCPELEPLTRSGDRGTGGFWRWWRVSRADGDGGADVDGGEELARFPIGHPHTAVRGGVAGEVAGVQAVAGLEFHEKGHGRADEVGAGRPALFPGVYIGFHDCAVGVDVIAIQAGAVVAIQAQDLEMPGGSGIALAAGRDAGLGDRIAAAQEHGALPAQAHDYGGFAFVQRGEI